MLDNEKDGTEDVNWSKSSKEPIITNAEDKQVASYQNISSDKIEGLDEKKGAQFSITHQHEMIRVVTHKKVSSVSRLSF